MVAQPLPLSTAAQLAQVRYGGPTRLRETRVTVGTVPTRLVIQDPKRVHWTAVNRSVNFGAIGFGNDLTAANGALVGANGGLVVLDVYDDGEVVAWEAFAINDTAAGTWYVYEVLRV